MEPFLLGTVDVSHAGKNTKLYVGDINQDGRMEVIMVQPDGGIDDRYVPHQIQSMAMLCMLIYWDRAMIKS